MTTEENFFVRQDVTGFFTMLQGPRARGGAERGACGVGRGVGLRSVVRRGFAVGRGVGLRGGVGIRTPARGGVGIRAPARGGDYLG